MRSTRGCASRKRTTITINASGKLNDSATLAAASGWTTELTLEATVFATSLTTVWISGPGPTGSGTDGARSGAGPDAGVGAEPEDVDRRGVTPATAIGGVGLGDATGATAAGLAGLGDASGVGDGNAA